MAGMKHGTRLKTDAQRVLRYQESPSGCWEWTGSLDSGGYGRMGALYGEKAAHRASFVFHKGPIPAGMLVLHECDNRKCINPAHLFLGSHTDNINDCVRKGRRPNHRGSLNPFAKLTEQQVVAILADNRTQPEIAADYGVSRSTIGEIKRGRNYAHVPRTANATERAKMNLR